MPYSIIIRQLVGIAIIFFVAIINPINLKGKEGLSLAILGISIGITGIIYILIYRFYKKGNEKILKFLNIALYVVFGIMLKFVFYKMNLYQFFICIITVCLYLTVISIITMHIKKLAIPAFLMAIVVCYLVFKYVDLKNVYVFFFLVNTFTYWINLKSAMIKIHDNEYEEKEIIMTQSVLAYLFIAQVCCFISLIKM